MTQQNSLQTGSSMSFSCSNNDSRIPPWLQSSEDMERCSKGNFSLVEIQTSKLLNVYRTFFMVLCPDATSALKSRKAIFKASFYNRPCDSEVRVTSPPLHVKSLSPVLSVASASKKDRTPNNR